MISCTRKIYSFRNLRGWVLHFALFQVASKFTYYRPFLLWVPGLWFIWKTCKSAKRSLEQGHTENPKSALQNSLVVAAFDSQWRICQKSALHCLHKYLNILFFLEITVSFIGAKMRVMGSLGHNWARLVTVNDLVPFDPQVERTSAHSDVIKELHDVWDDIYTLRPRQNGRHFADDIFKRIFLNENIWIPIKISLKFVPKGSINNIPALVQIMAWRRPGDKPLSEPMMVNLPTHICVTRPQWVNEGLHLSRRYIYYLIYHLCC